MFMGDSTSSDPTIIPDSQAPSSSAESSIVSPTPQRVYRVRPSRPLSTTSMQVDAVQPPETRRAGRWAGARTYGRRVTDTVDSADTNTGASSRPFGASFLEAEVATNLSDEGSRVSRSYSNITNDSRAENDTTLRFDASPESKVGSKGITFDLSDEDDGGSTFMFAWRKQEKEIDRMFDEEEARSSDALSSSLPPLTPSEPSSSAPVLAKSASRRVRLGTDSASEEGLEDKDGHAPSPHTTPNASRLHKRRAIISTSESEADQGRDRDCEKDADTTPKASAEQQRHSPAADLGLDEDTADPILKPRANIRKNRKSLRRALGTDDEDDALGGKENVDQESDSAASDIENKVDAKGKSRAKSRRESGGRGKGAKPKIKAPTKKEIEETKKESARMKADQQVSHQKANLHKYTMSNLFGKIQAPVPTRRPAEHAPPSSDPIQSFSSSPNIQLPEHSKPVVKPTSKLTYAGGRGASRAPRLQADEADDDDVVLPDAADIVRAVDEQQKLKLEEERRVKELHERKMRLIAAAKAKPTAPLLVAGGAESDGDDLEIVAEEKKPAHPLTGSRKPATSKAKLLAMAHVSSGNLKEESQLEFSSRQLAFANAGALAGSSSRVSSRLAQKDSALTSDHGPRKGRTSMKHSTLNETLLKESSKRAAEIVKQKEEEWIRRGGRSNAPAADGEGTDDMGKWIEKGLLNAKKHEEQRYDDDSEDDEDGEWKPEDVADRGSASPLPAGSDSEEGGVGMDENEGHENADDDKENMDEDKENRGGTLSRRPGRGVLEELDDGEIQDSNEIAPAVGRFSTLQHSPTPRRLSERADDPDLPLPRLPLSRPDGGNDFLSRLGELDDDELPVVTRKRSGRPKNTIHSDDEDNPFDIQSHSQNDMPPPVQTNRRALQDVGRREDLSLSFLLSSSPADGRRGNGDNGLGGLRTLERELSGGSTNEIAKDSALAGEGESLESDTQASGGFSQFFGSEDDKSQTKSFSDLRTGGDGLDSETQPTDHLLPAIHISEAARRDNDEMFREQEEGLMARPPPLTEAERRIYMNSQGFLTQTEPIIDINRNSLGESQDDFHRLAINQFTSSPRATASSPHKAQPTRRILKRGIHLSDDHSQDLDTPLSPLRVQSPPVDSTPRPGKNAFDILRQGAAEQARPKELGKRKRKLNKLDFVVGEAEESDEDALFGFGSKQHESDEDSDDEAQNRPVEGLVDDTAMDYETQAVDLVLEKVKEHQELDDAELEKLAQAAVAGKLRGKRRDGRIGFADSSSESEDEENRARRKAMAKKRRIDGDGLETLAKNPETRPFYDQYQKDLQGGSEDGYEDPSADEALSEDERETVDVHEVRSQLLEASRSKKTRTEPAVNLDKLINGDDSDEEMAYNVKEVSAAKKKPRQGELDFSRQAAYRHRRAAETDEKDRARLSKWAKEESQNRSSFGGTNAGGSATVTGHARSSSKPSTSKASSQHSASTSSQPSRTSSLHGILGRKNSGFAR